MKRPLFTLLTWAGFLCVAVIAFTYFGGGEHAAHAAVAGKAGGGGLLAFGFAGLVDIFDTRTMLEAVEQMKRPSTFLRDKFFPQAPAVDTETVDVDIIKGKRRMAPFVSPLAEGKPVEALGFSSSAIKPGYIKPKKPTTAEQLLHRSPGATIYQGNETIEQRAQKRLGQDLAELMDMIDRREEWMAAKALDAGAVTMKIKGETTDKVVTVDFLMPASHKVTLAGVDLWSDTANSDPIAKLRAWAQVIRQDSGLSPDALILGTDAATAYMNHPKVQKFMDMRAVDAGEIRPAELPNGVSYVGRIKAPGLFVDVFTYDDWYVDEDSGTEAPFVPVKKAWLGCTRAANKTLYAVIQDVEAIEGGQAAVPRFPKSWVTKDPAVRWAMVQSAPLTALLQPDAFVSAQVLP